LYNFIPIFFRIFCGLDTIFIMPVIFKYLFNLLSCPLLFQRISNFLNI
jgi:hypothetical protein